MRKALIIGAIAGPALLWLGMVTVGGKRADAAGNLLVRPGPPGWPPLPSNAALWSAAAGALAAYLTAG